MNIMKSAQGSLSRTLKLTGLATAILSAGSIQAEDVQILGVDDVNRIDNQYIVVLKENSSSINIYADKQSFVNAAAKDVIGNVGAKVRKKYSNALLGFAVTADEEQLEKLQNNPLVKYIEVDKTFTINGSQSNATWGLDRIDQDDIPLDYTYNYAQTGAGVDVYIVDTGINKNHSDFTNRVGAGYDAVDNDSDPADCQGHGSHVAGSTAGTKYGVAKGATIHGVRVLNCEGSGQTSDIIEGIDWVIGNKTGDAVINMSLGGSASQAMDDAAAKSWDAGIVTVVAAGNDNSDACNYSPARSSKAITTGSTDKLDSRSSFSNYGSCVDIFAPGTDITSVKYNDNNGSTTMSGTSMASPHVAGAAALYLEANPGSTPAQVLQGLLTSAISNTLTDVKSGSPNKMLNIDFTGGGTDPEPEPSDLLNGESISIAGGKGSQKVYTFEVPAGATDIAVTMSGGNGDADLYVKRGQEPTNDSYDCRPYNEGNEESCSLTEAGTYYVGITGYAEYSGVSLLGEYTGGDTTIPSKELESGKPKTGIKGTKGSENKFIFNTPKGAQNIKVSMSGGTGDADLYIKLGSEPTTSSYDCRPYKDGNNESCDLTGSGEYHILLLGYTDYNGISLLGQYGDGGGQPTGLENGVAKTNLSGAKDSEVFETFIVPAGASNISIAISGGSGDADLYIKKGSNPTESSYDCRPFKDGNSESCSLSEPGTYHIMLKAYKDYSGISLLGQYDE